jgi:hypothetical protein
MVEFNTTGLSHGEYTYHLTIDDPNAANTPMVIPVYVEVIKPAIGRRPHKFEFSLAQGLVHAPEPLTIWNGAKGILNWQITCDCNWLIIEPNSGVSDDRSSEISLKADTSELALGDYACTITISDPNASNSPQTVPVALRVSPEVVNVPGDYATIQEAIDNAGEGAEVIVQPGTYTGEGNYDIRFRGKAITVRSADPNDPEIVASTVVDCNDRGGGFIFDDNEDASSVLSGFCIVNCRYSRGGRGPAVFCHRSSPLIGNSIIMHNSYGGIYVQWGNPAVRNCKIVNNGGYRGAGIFVHESRVTIENCMIGGNSAKCGGGIFCSAYSEVVVRHSLISGNKALELGGGLFCEQCDVVIDGCTIAGNAAGERGGGIYSHRSSQAISDSIVWGNTAPIDRQIVAVKCPHDRGGGPIPMVISYSDIQGGQAAVNIVEECTLNWGPDNIESDPCFARPGYWVHINDPNMSVEPNDPNAMWVDGDYHLKSAYGRWDANSRAWVFDEVTSLCIDGADPNLDWKEELWPHGERANLGAYGGTAEASMSPNSVGNIADLDLDGFVYRTDLPFLLGAWLSDATPIREDLTRNGIVDFADFSVFGSEYERPALPDQAKIISPSDGAVDVSRMPVLSWLSEPNALWHDVYLGTESPGIFQGRVSSTTFEPGILGKNTWYYWRIDEIDPGGMTTGEVWSFQTRPGPEPASNPYPADGSTQVHVRPILSWEAGEGATSHNVYFGTSSPGDIQANRIETTFDPGYLEYETTYYWRIDEVNDLQTTEGPVWTFTTVRTSR